MLLWQGVYAWWMDRKVNRTSKTGQ